MRFKNVYQDLNGHEPTTEQVLKFERLVSTLETTPGDAMLAVLVALDHYENLYAGIPNKINESIEKTLTGLNCAAKKQAVKALAAAKSDMSKAVADVANKVASDVSKKQKWQWAGGSVVISFVCISVLTWYMHQTGYDAGLAVGRATGYEQAKDQIAAAAWANTMQGKRAYKLANTSALDKIMDCNQPGWVKKEGACFVYPAPDGMTYGWVLQ